MLEKARKQIDGGSLERYAAEIASTSAIRIRWWRRLCGAQNAHRFDGGTGVPAVQRGRAALHRKIVSQWKVIYGISIDHLASR